MKKGHWYRHLFGRIDQSIQQDFYFEAAFIAYGIIEDRLTSLKRHLGNTTKVDGVKKKIEAITKIKSPLLEQEFDCDNWGGTQYLNKGLLQEVLEWGELYRNPMQHLLGDPRVYHALYGSFHVDNTKDLAIEGKAISRKLSSAVMRLKKKK